MRLYVSNFVESKNLAMKQIAITVIIFFSAISCIQENPIAIKLDCIHEAIRINPEDALPMLDSIDAQQLTSSRLRAKHSLLYSVALDRNYIDITTDSIITPALKYYSHRGTPDGQCATYYYAARIYENAGDLEKAMMSIAKISEIDTSKVHPGLLRRIHFLKGRIYESIWRRDEAIQAYETAVRYAQKDNDIDNYIQGSLIAASLYFTSGNTDKCHTLIESISKYQNNFSERNFHYYHDLNLALLLESSQPKSNPLQYAIDYLDRCPNKDSELINWKNIALAYLKGDFASSALESLEKHPTYHDISKDAGYHSIKSDILSALGKHEMSLESYRKYCEINDSTDFVIHKSDIKLIEERFISELEQTKQRHWWLLICIILIATITYTIVVIRKKKNAELMLKKEISDLEIEYKTLISIHQQLKDNNSITENEYIKLQGQLDQMISQVEDNGTTEQAVNILGERLHSLSAFLQTPIPDSLSKVCDKVSNLKSSKNYIVDNIGILYALKYPKFVSELRDFGLTSAEIGFCCLYILGLNKYEISNVIGKSSIYNINSGIRKKLTLSSVETNLDIWLKRRFEALYG